MKYNIGDKIRVNSVEWYNKNKNNFGYINNCGVHFTPDMSIFCNCILTIKEVGYDVYYVEENVFAWTEDMFEGLADCKESIEITLNDKNYIIDVKRAIELGVVKEKCTKCKSWEEFKKKYLKKQGFFYNECDMSIALTNNPTKVSEQLTENEAIAIKAFSKLLKLRRDWVGDWEPNWGNAERKYCICIIDSCNHFTISSYCCDHHTFSFPTEEMAKEFFYLFKDLFEDCKILI